MGCTAPGMGLQTPSITFQRLQEIYLTLTMVSEVGSNRLDGFQGVRLSRWVTLGFRRDESHTTAHNPSLPADLGGTPVSSRNTSESEGDPPA